MARVRGRLLGIAEPPPRIGRYRIHGRRGHGGMGLVYVARDDELDRPVAIKVLRRDLAGSDARRRFLREAQALARLSHPNIVQVYEVGHHDHEVFIAMELVEGTTLCKWCAAQPRTWREIVRMFVAAGRGLAAAHRIGLVHGDFEPDNVIVDGDERPRVLDFGVAQLHAEPIGIVPVSIAPCTSGSMTLPGSVMGTVPSMAPEQRYGQRADARADQFAFAVALSKALKRRVPTRLHTALERAMATDPADRWPSMDALLAQL
jgi:serine/threonine protein kinase